MEFLYISGQKDVFSRHELGFIAALRSIGKVDVLRLGAERSYTDIISVISDNGYNDVTIMHLDISSSIIHPLTLSIDRYIEILEEIDELTGYETIFATPRIPALLASILSKRFNVPAILRLWSIRAFKVLDYVKYGVYHEIFNVIPSFLANLVYITLSSKTMFLDDFTYRYAKKIISTIQEKISQNIPSLRFYSHD